MTPSLYLKESVRRPCLADRLFNDADPVAVAAAMDHSMLIDGDGVAYSWGVVLTPYPTCELGFPDQPNSFDEPEPLDLGATKIILAACGETTTWLLDENGGVLALSLIHI